MSSGAVHFSTKGEYGVRLMVELARHYGEGPLSLADVAEHEDLPRPYLEQLVVSLREAELVVSHRGARGGYTLGRPPAQIRMGDVLRALEGPIVPMICAAHDRETSGQCGRTTFCTVNTLWVKVRDAISDAVDSLTLADLALPLIPAPGAHPAHAVV
jgi:Rrf2 family cysteine metabolism transcriptional repressor